MSTSDNEDDLTPDLEELDSENDDEHVKLSQILQKISECKFWIVWFINKYHVGFCLVCFTPKEHGVQKLREWIMKSEPRAREQLQAMSTSTMDQSTLVDTTFSKTANVCFININILKILICHQDFSRRYDLSYGESIVTFCRVLSIIMF